MSYPKVNWPTALNIAKSLMAVENFYTQTCDLMKSMLLPLPFVQSEENTKETLQPSYKFHTILEFVCSRVNQIVENDSLTAISLSALSELLCYFKDKQVKEYKENLKLVHKHKKQSLLEKVAEIQYKLLSAQEIQEENKKKQAYSGNKRKNKASFDPGPEKKKTFYIEEPQTEYCETDLNSFEDLYNNFDLPSKQEIKSQCMPLSSIPQNLLLKCKNEAPSSCLYLYNLPKKIEKNEIFQLLRSVFQSKDCSDLVKLEILQGRLKGQGFLHVDSVQTATDIRETLFGFPLQGKPLILVTNI